MIEKLPTLKRNARYTIVYSFDLNDFINAVNNKLQNGWRCQGGLSVSFNDNGSDKGYFQSMVLDQE